MVILITTSEMNSKLSLIREIPMQEWDTILHVYDTEEVGAVDLIAFRKKSQILEDIIRKLLKICTGIFH